MSVCATCHLPTPLTSTNQQFELGSAHVHAHTHTRAHGSTLHITSHLNCHRAVSQACWAFPHTPPNLFLCPHAAISPLSCFLSADPTSNIRPSLGATLPFSCESCSFYLERPYSSLPTLRALTGSPLSLHHVSVWGNFLNFFHHLNQNQRRRRLTKLTS